MGPLTLAVNSESFTRPLTPKTKIPGFLSFIHCGRIGFLFGDMVLQMHVARNFRMLLWQSGSLLHLSACRMISHLISYVLYLAKRELNDPENAIIGAFAGALTGVITTPLDVIKTRLMVQYKGIVECVQTIVREEGPPALLKGIGPRVLWIGIGVSIFLVFSREQSAYLLRDDQQLVKTRSRTNL